MKELNCKTNIFLYRLYVIFNEPLFWGPILIVSLQKLAGMSLPGIFYMESAVLIICVLLDIPFGALADIIGRKKTIIIGRLFLFLSVCMFAFMSSPLHAWTANILWAIGYTLQSGADTSFLYDTLKECGRESEYKKIEGKSVGARFFVIAFCSLTVGFLASIDLRLPLYLSIPFVFIPLVSSFFIHEPIYTKVYSVQKQVDILKQGLVFLLQSKEVRFMVGFATLVSCISKVWFFTYNPYFEIVNLDISYYGFIFFLLNVVAWLSSHYAHKIESHLGEGNCILFMILCIGVPLIIMGLFPLEVCVYLLVVQNLVRGFMKPFIGDYMHKHVATGIRATTMSIESAVSNFASIISLAMFGMLIEHVSLLHSLIILGVTTLVLGIYSYFVYRKKIA